MPNMSNLSFFRACFQNELQATLALIESLPAGKLDYRPHPVNRSAAEIVEHILGHVKDLKTILLQTTCDETLVYPFESPADAAGKYRLHAEELMDLLGGSNDEKWEKEQVELLINSKSFINLGDIIQHYHSYNMMRQEQSSNVKMQKIWKNGRTMNTIELYYNSSSENDKLINKINFLKKS